MRHTKEFIISLTSVVGSNCLLSSVFLTLGLEAQHQQYTWQGFKRGFFTLLDLNLETVVV